MGNGFYWQQESTKEQVRAMSRTGGKQWYQSEEGNVIYYFSGVSFVRPEWRIQDRNGEVRYSAPCSSAAPSPSPPCGGYHVWRVHDWLPKGWKAVPEDFHVR